MLKDFEELRKVDVLPYCDMREAKDDKGRKIEVPYLNWAKCIDLLHEYGAKEVYFTPLTNVNGSSLFMSDMSFAKDADSSPNRCYEVAIEIVIDERVFIMRGPVMNGSNPVRDNSMSQQRVWNAQTRAFVKGVAIHTGLGFDLWCKTENNEDAAATKEEDLSAHKIMKIKERCQIAYTKLITKGMSTSDIAKALNKSEEEVKVLFTFFEQIERFEKELNAI